MQRAITTGALTALAVLLLLAGTGGGDAISLKQKATARHEFDVVRWEATHFLDKWWNQLLSLLPGRCASEEERQAAISAFFDLGDQVRELEEELEAVVARPREQRERSPEDVQAELEELLDQRKRLQTVVEEAMESEISSVLDELGISGKLGAIRWPPVDFTFEGSPLVLVTSPRDEIVRLDDVVLKSGLDLFTQEGLEAELERIRDVSALVVPTGGIATYPAHVSPTRSLHSAAILASHEWLHHFLFFRPLGARWFTGGDLASINETMANITGREIGDRVFTRLTGEVVERPPYVPPTLQDPSEPAPDTFDFRREMRRTRLRLDELLAESRVDEAEAYLEERRLVFVANGFNIRKLNTAFFAFFGTYADNPASVSLIEPQLQTIRADSADLAEFLGRVSAITSNQELEEKARAAGWEPPF